ncbi:MAG: tetratricopeptide repeat protein [Thermosynechococcaceae cyanobacterium]
MMAPQTAPVLIQQGNDALNQGDPVTALAHFQQALELDDHDPEVWTQCGTALQRLGRYPEAMIANTNAQALYVNRLAAIQPLPVTLEDPILKPQKSHLENYNFWLQRAAVLVNAGSYGLAIDSYDKALALQPEHPSIWNHRGMAFFQMGEFDDAVASFDQAIKLDPENYQPWHNRGSVLAEQDRYDEAISDYDVALRLTRQQLWPAWEDRGMCLYLLQGYQAAIATLDEGIAAMQPDNIEYDRACGILNQRKGDFQYREGYALVDPIPTWQEAKVSYLSAIDHLSFLQFPEQHLLTLQSFLTVCCHLGDHYVLQTTLPTAIEKRDRLLGTLTLSSEQRRSLKQELEGLEQLQIDLLAQQDVTQALVLADANRHDRLSDLSDLKEPVILDWAQIQKLLRPQSALLFWHLSPAAISIFVLKFNQFPMVLQVLPTDTLQATVSLRTAQAAAHQRHQLEDWLQSWQAQPPELETLERQLTKLRTILNIDRLCQEMLTDIDQITLVSDSNLIGVPLHALFPDTVTVSTLPSIQWGLALRRHRFPSAQFLRVALQPTAMETAGLERIYPRATSLAESQATKGRVLAALKLMSGQGWLTLRDFVRPPSQAIELAAYQTLTLDDIVQLDLSRFSLMCLSNALSKPTIPTTESVNLPTSFLLAGVAQVISSLWPVQEMPQGLLFLNLYQRLQGGASAPLALHQAQQWLRRLTYVELGEWSHQLGLDLPEAFMQNCKVCPENRPYAELIHWAGFYIMGN